MSYYERVWAVDYSTASTLAKGDILCRYLVILEAFGSQEAGWQASALAVTKWARQRLVDVDSPRLFY